MKKFFEFSDKIISESLQGFGYMSTGITYKGSFNHIDVFTSDQFDKDVGRGVAFPLEYAKIINKRYNFKTCVKETELLVYDSVSQKSIFINVKPEGTFRHQVLFERVFYNVKNIPHLTKTGQIRIILNDSDFSEYQK